MVQICYTVLQTMERLFFTFSKYIWLFAAPFYVVLSQFKDFNISKFDKNTKPL